MQIIVLLTEHCIYITIRSFSFESFALGFVLFCFPAALRLLFFFLSISM